MVEKALRLGGQVNILQCQQIAKRLGFDKVEFDLVGPTGTLHCKWRDAYLGMFDVEGYEETFFMAKDFAFLPDVVCKNILVK